MDAIVTSDLSQFGYRELELAQRTLKAYVDSNMGANLKIGEGLKICFNRNSGFVFLSDEDLRTFVLNGKEELTEWFNCPICGTEGYKELVNKPEHHDNPDDGECKQWILDTFGT